MNTSSKTGFKISNSYIAEYDTYTYGRSYTITTGTSYQTRSSTSNTVYLTTCITYTKDVYSIVAVDDANVYAGNPGNVYYETYYQSWSNVKSIVARSYAGNYRYAILFTKQYVSTPRYYNGDPSITCILGSTYSVTAVGGQIIRLTKMTISASGFTATGGGTTTTCTLQYGNKSVYDLNSCTMTYQTTGTDGYYSTTNTIYETRASTYNTIYLTKENIETLTSTSWR